jgi:phosphohistidine phosphatase
MKLYLVRHGQPNSELTDPEKNLSPAGEDEIRLLTSTLAAQNIAVKEIWHSEKNRARQTAQIIGSGIHVHDAVVEKKGISPTDRVDPVVGRILAFQSDLLIVTHLPFIAHLLSLLLTGDEYKMSFEYNTGCTTCLDYANGRWALLWFINPQLLKRADSIAKFGH